MRYLSRLRALLCCLAATVSTSVINAQTFSPRALLCSLAATVSTPLISAQTFLPHALLFTAPAHRGAQLYSQFSSNNQRGDSRGVASVVSLATTRVQHAAAAATAAAAGHTARGEYVCGCCQRLVSGEERARWLCQLFSVACDASPHLSPCMNPRTDFCS